VISISFIFLKKIKIFIFFKKLSLLVKVEFAFSQSIEQYHQTITKHNMK